MPKPTLSPPQQVPPSYWMSVLILRRTISSIAEETDDYSSPWPTHPQSFDSNSAQVLLLTVSPFLQHLFEPGVGLILNDIPPAEVLLLLGIVRSKVAETMRRSRRDSAGSRAGLELLLYRSSEAFTSFMQTNSAMLISETEWRGSEMHTPFTRLKNWITKERIFWRHSTLMPLQHANEYKRSLKELQQRWDFARQSLAVRYLMEKSVRAYRLACHGDYNANIDRLLFDEVVIDVVSELLKWRQAEFTRKFRIAQAQKGAKGKLSDEEWAVTSKRVDQYAANGMSRIDAAKRVLQELVDGSLLGRNVQDPPGVDSIRRKPSPAK